MAETPSADDTGAWESATQPPAPNESATLPPANASAHAAGPDAVPGYEILGELGRGGMGVVYKARHLQLNRLVAIKMILSGGHASAHDHIRFRVEAEAVARLQHPHIVQVHEFGEAEGRPYFTLEFVEGGSLAALLDGAPRPAHWSAELIETLARAMHYAHQQGIVHRDLKPANVLLSVVSDQSLVGSTHEPRTTDNRQATNAKITDFGLAKQLDSQKGHTQTGAVMGTPSYMAPEQAGGLTKSIGPAVDVYALGAILYELVTGRPPFRAETPLDTVLQVISVEPVPPRRLQPKLPADLETICLKCLEKDPRKRYASAEELADDLRRFVNGEPILARPTQSWERLWKWARRRPAVAALSAVSVLVTLIGLGLVTWKWREAEAAYVSAENARQGEEVQRTATEKALSEARLNLYLNNIALAEREWLANNVGRARSLLEACPVELRRWEWQYLHRAFKPELLTVPAQSSNMHWGLGAIAYHPNGKLLAAPGEDFSVQIWEVATGRLVQSLKGHSRNIAALTYSPDGRWLASGAGIPAARAPGEIKLWDAETGRLMRTLTDHEGGVQCLVFRPDGQELASAGGGAIGQTIQEITVWNPATGNPIRVFSALPGLISSLDYSPDGRILVASGVSYQETRGIVKAWDARSGADLPPFEGHDRAIVRATFSPDSQRLATGGLDQTIILWDVPTRKPLRRLYGHSGHVACLQFTPDGLHLVSGGADHTVRAWNAATGKELLTLRGHKGPVGGVACRSDGLQIASIADTTTGSEAQCEVKLWSAVAGDREPILQRAHRGLVLGLAFSPDGNWVASAGYDSQIRVAPSRSSGQTHVLRGRPGRSNAVAFSPDSRHVASLTLDGSLSIREFDTGKTQRKLMDGAAALRWIAFSPDGLLLAAEVGDPLSRQPGEIVVWNLQTLAKVHTSKGHGGAFHPTNPLLALARPDHAIEVLETSSWQPQRTLTGHSDHVVGLAYDRGGGRLASAGWDRTVRLWDAETGALLHQLAGHSEPVWSVSFGADGARLASASLSFPKEWHGEVKVWDVDSGQLALTLPGNAAVAFSPDGKQLAGLDTDVFLTSAVMLWDANTLTESDEARRRANADHMSVEWHLRLADECLAQRLWHGVVFHLDSVIAERPGVPFNFSRRGYARAALGQWDAAAADYQRAFESGANSSNVWYQFALVCFKRGDPESYRRHCAKALEKFGALGTPEASIAIAWVCKIGPDALKDYCRAVELTEQAVKARSTDSYYLNNLGGILYRAGRYQDSVNQLQKALKQRRDDMHVWEWIWLAMAYARLGQTADARKFYEQSERWLNNALASSTADSTRFSWEVRLELEMLRREMQTTVDAGATSTAK